VSIELSDEQIKRALHIPLRENVVVWQAQKEDIAKKLVELISEVLILCASTAERQGATLGIKSGLSLIHAWKDNRE